MTDTARIDTAHDLSALWDPASVAVVGASSNPAKWGYWLASGALEGRHRRAVHLVNQRGGRLRDTPFAASLADLPSPPEHIVVAVPAAHVHAVVAQGLELGARQFTVITAGADPAQEAELAALVRSRGARLLGPNCMGVVDTGTGLRLSWGDFPSGRVGLVSQSGNLALEIGRLLGRAGEGFSRFVSLGNQGDIDAADALESLVAHEPTRVIAAYVEDFRDGRRLARILAAARDADKAVLLLTVGRSEASARAAASHTGALVSALATVDALCEETGALRLDSAGQLVDTVQALLAPALPAGRRVAIAGDSGGQGALAADALAARGLTVPRFTAATRDLLAALPPQTSRGNPVDLAGAGEADLGNYARAVRALLLGGDADAAVLTGYFGDYATGDPAQEQRECEVAAELAAAVRASGRPLAVHTMARDTAALRTLRALGVPVYERIEQAADALAHAARWAAGHALPPPPPRTTAPHPVPLADGHYATVRTLLSAYGIAFPRAEFVTDADEAVKQAAVIGHPVVLKAMGLAHKTEAGGVALGLADDDAVRTAFGRMRQRTGASHYVVEAMVRQPHAVELIIGVRRDPAFGPVAMVGIGGITAELLADTAVGLAPLSPQRARELLLSLRHSPLLLGWRDAPPVDLDAAADALVALSQAGADHPELSEIEINPLLVHPGGAIALDTLGSLS
ncbi:acyl-CoA synthetase (NDP forming) [Streptacidiphilus sp. MAP12-20]|uniref:acetate--CoA ligase family protein n=1 Tax=Streptacidiphilus sp. MAP12-20 TaxID=3156299 RepID=UPI003515A3B7